MKLKATEKQLELIRKHEAGIREINAESSAITVLVKSLRSGDLGFLPKEAANVFTFVLAEPTVSLLREWDTSDLIEYLDSLKAEPVEEEVPEQKYIIEGYNGEWTYGCTVPNSENCIAFSGSSFMVVPKSRLIPVDAEPEVRVLTSEGITSIAFKGKELRAITINSLMLPEGLTPERVVEAILQA